MYICIYLMIAVLSYIYHIMNFYLHLSSGYSVSRFLFFPGCLPSLVNVIVSPLLPSYEGTQSERSDLLCASVGSN